MVCGVVLRILFSSMKNGDREGRFHVFRAIGRVSEAGTTVSLPIVDIRFAHDSQREVFGQIANHSGKALTAASRRGGEVSSSASTSCLALWLLSCCVALLCVRVSAKGAAGLWRMRRYCLMPVV